MQKAHKSGMAVVGIWVFEMAEVRAGPKPPPPTSRAPRPTAARAHCRPEPLQAYCDQLKSGGLIASVTEADDD